MAKCYPLVHATVISSATSSAALHACRSEYEGKRKSRIAFRRTHLKNLVITLVILEIETPDPCHGIARSGSRLELLQCNKSLLLSCRRAKRGGAIWTGGIHAIHKSRLICDTGVVFSPRYGATKFGPAVRRSGNRMPTTGDTRPVFFISRLPRLWRLAGLALLGLALTLSFLAYLSPDMQLQWETLAALCGF